MEHLTESTTNPGIRDENIMTFFAEAYLYRPCLLVSWPDEHGSYAEIPHHILISIE